MKKRILQLQLSRRIWDVLIAYSPSVVEKEGTRRRINAEVYSFVWIVCATAFFTLVTEIESLCIQELLLLSWLETKNLKGKKAPFYLPLTR